ncbi:FUSC family protein [Neisseriaceae bacterium TC5R-5]|nr:FUSC family protein [Neisseriaceae bacterium TC5R-5]
MMNSLNSRTLKWPQQVRASWQDWLSTEGENAIFVIKTLLAGFAALWLAFRFNLGSPSTAMMTVFIVSFPRSGMVLEKSAYRLLGTLLGSVAALVLIGMMASEPILLLVALSLWVGLCASGATLLRNSRSYGFVLAGYTACIIALPALNHPLAVFDIAVTRVSEISLGLLCCAIVNDALFPRHQGDLVVDNVRSRYLSFVSLCQDGLLHKLNPHHLEHHQLKFAADIAALEAGRATAFFEAGHVRSRSQQLHAFNATFMAALTTFHTLQRQGKRLRQQPDSPLPALLQALFDSIAAALSDEQGPARTAAAAKGTVQRLAQLRAGWEQQLAVVQQTLLDTPQAQRWQVDFDTACDLLTRFIEEMHAFSSVYHGFATQNPQQIQALASYTPLTPGPIVLASGLRTALSLSTLSFAWYWLAWPSGLDAVLIATIFCGLAASAPKPTVMVKQILQGFILGAPLAYICTFHVLNQGDGFAMLVLGMLPFLALSCYLKCWPRFAGMGSGMALMVVQAVNPENIMNYDVVAFLNGSMARILGLGLSALFFMLILPSHTMGSPRHIAAELWREALRACHAKLPHLKQRYQNRIRDLLNQLNSSSAAQAAQVEIIVGQAVTLLELGLSVINLRTLQTQPQLVACNAGLSTALQQLALYFQNPSSRQLQLTIYALEQTGPQLRQVLAQAQAEQAAQLRQTLIELHLIYTSLLDIANQTAVVTTEGNPHAA